MKKIAVPHTKFSGVHKLLAVVVIASPFVPPSISRQ